MKTSRLFISLVVALSGIFGVNAARASEAVADSIAPTGYLFVYFAGNDRPDESIHYAISHDGKSFRALNGKKPIVSSDSISLTGGVRDPHILRHDGRFYMAVTDMVCSNGWDSNRGLVLMQSDDLVNWKSSAIDFTRRYEGQDSLKRVWAPQTIYDPEAGKLMVYFSMKHGSGTDIIYYAYANSDFTDLEGEPKVLFMPKNRKSCIDADIVNYNGLYHMFYKTEGHGNGIKKATSPSLTSGNWSEHDGYKQVTSLPVEGSGLYPVIGRDAYVLMYDVYTSGKYEFTESSDLENFKLIEGVTLDFHPRHGSVLPITADEISRLESAFPY